MNNCWKQQAWGLPRLAVHRDKTMNFVRLSDWDIAFQFTVKVLVNKGFTCAHANFIGGIDFQCSVQRRSTYLELRGFVGSSSMNFLGFFLMKEPNVMNF